MTKHLYIVFTVNYRLDLNIFDLVLPEFKGSMPLVTPCCYGYPLQSAETLNSVASHKLAKKEASMKETVVMHSSQITQGKLGKVDISFLPKTVRPFSDLTPDLSFIVGKVL